MADHDAATPFWERARETARLGRLAARLAWRASPRLVLGILALLVAQAALAPLQLALSRAVVDRAALDLGLGGAAGATVARLPLAAWIALAAAALAVGQLIQPFSATFQALVGDRLTAYVTEQLIAAANRWRGLARFEDPAFADDLERARKYAAKGGLELLVYGGQGALALFTAAGLALTLAGLHPLAPVALVAATLPQMAWQWEYRRRTSSHLHVQTPEARRLRYCRDVLLTPEAAKDVRLYGLGPFFRGRYDAIFARTIAMLDRLRRRLMARVALAGFLAAATAGGVYVYAVWAVAGGWRTLGDLVLYGGAVTILQANLQQVGFSIGFLPMVFEFLPSLFRVLDAPPDLPLPPDPRPAPRPIREGIVFEDVWFGYPGGTAPVLRGLSCHLRPGECAALVGHNGRARRPSSSCCCGSTTRPPGASCSTASICASTTSTICAARWA